MSEARPHPVRIIVTDDLHRNRWTVFFRFFLAIPHYIWAFLIGQAVAIAVFVNWFVLMFKAKTPGGSGCGLKMQPATSTAPAV